jgi:hypothetical protein
VLWISGKGPLDCRCACRARLAGGLAERVRHQTLSLPGCSAILQRTMLSQEPCQARGPAQKMAEMQADRHRKMLERINVVRSRCCDAQTRSISQRSSDLSLLQKAPA